MSRISKILVKAFITGIVVVACLVGYSFSQARKIEKSVLIPSLSKVMKYERHCNLKICDPFVSYFPHWTISYSEVPTVVSYESPSISIGLTGRVIDWSSKDVISQMVHLGYAKDY